MAPRKAQERRRRTSFEVPRPRKVLPASPELPLEEGNFFRGILFAVPLGLSAWAGLAYLALKLHGLRASGAAPYSMRAICKPSGESAVELPLGGSRIVTTGVG
jgi:hypothetical protein